jgi:hypothetical protein
MTMTRTSLGGSILASILAIIVIPAVGCHKPVLPATVFEVKVGPRPCDLVPPGDVTVSKSRGDTVKWSANSTTQPLTITFRQSMLPVKMKPFMNMIQQANGDWTVGASLQSGQINPNLTVPAAGLTYKYDQTIGAENCDGRIIIQR